MNTTTLAGLLLNDRGIAFDPVKGETYQLSVTALELIRLILDGADEARLLGHLTDTYDVSPLSARRDLQAFLGTLERMRWI